MIGFLEGAMFYGSSTATCTGATSLSCPTEDRTLGLRDHGPADRNQRLAFLGLVVGASNGDIAAQLAALRDLGAFADDIDLHHVIDELDLERPPVDPTELTRRRARRGDATVGQGAARDTAPASRRN